VRSDRQGQMRLQARQRSNQRHNASLASGAALRRKPSYAAWADALFLMPNACRGPHRVRGGRQVHVHSSRPMSQSPSSSPLIRHRFPAWRWVSPMRQG
jgi:hypothetical protein